MAILWWYVNAWFTSILIFKVMVERDFRLLDVSFFPFLHLLWEVYFNSKSNQAIMIMNSCSPVNPPLLNLESTDLCATAQSKKLPYLICFVKCEQNLTTPAYKTISENAFKEKIMIRSRDLFASRLFSLHVRALLCTSNCLVSANWCMFVYLLYDY